MLPDWSRRIVTSKPEKPAAGAGTVCACSQTMPDCAINNSGSKIIARLRMQELHYPDSCEPRQANRAGFPGLPESVSGRLYGPVQSGDRLFASAVLVVGSGPGNPD